MKKSILFNLLLILFVFTSFLQAGTKEELIRLQNDIHALQEQFRLFEKTLHENNTGLAGVKDLIEQLNDQAAKTNMLLEKTLAALDQQDSGYSPEDDEILPELRSLSGKIDDMSMSISALARQVSELKVQSTPMNASMSQNLTAADTLFNQAYYDLLEENYDLAIGGFTAYLMQFPSGDKVSAARYNIGEAYFYTSRFQDAITAYTQVIEENADSGKVASALLHRGKSYLEIVDSTRAIEDFKAVIRRFPEAPEAALAKVELQDLGVKN